jgi:SPP1 gp7 family putative phage head morphogenesis protein
MIKNANTLIYDKVIDRAAMVRLFERRINEKVELVLGEHRIRVDSLISKAKNVKQLHRLLDKEISKTMKEAYRTSKDSLIGLAKDQISFAYQNLDASLKDVWRTRRPQQRVAEELVLSKPLIENKLLEPGWYGIGLGERKRLEQVIRKGLADGKSLDVIAVDVRRGNTHKITRNQSRALVVTATTSVFAQADHAVYQANSQALQGWQYVAVLDSRTTPICSHRDGEIYRMDETEFLPPAHYNCRSTTTPVVKSWDDLSKLEGIDQIRKRNLGKLTPKQVQFYDGQLPLKESYHEWLLRQTSEVQYRHLGDMGRVTLFQAGKLHLSKFTNNDGNSIGLRDLRRLTDAEYTVPGDTRRFALAKEKLDKLKLWASTPDDFIGDASLTTDLREYYLLQAGELDGTLSLTNFRGITIGSKRNNRRRVLSAPPREDQLIFNPISGRYEDSRRYLPEPAVLSNNLRLVHESDTLKLKDREFIEGFAKSLENKMSANEIAVIVDNLRITFSRFRKEGKIWQNFKAVSQAQIKFDVMNISDSLETRLRSKGNTLRKLLDESYIDPVLGATQLDSLHDSLIDNIVARNKWEDSTAPKLARKLREAFDLSIPPKIKLRLAKSDIQQFYLRFSHRLSLADTPDKDQFAVALGRDLFNLANLNGSRNQWFNLGNKILEKNNSFFKLETFGVQKRRMKSRMSGQLFGPYYDTFSQNIRVTDKRIQKYSKLQRKIDIGLRIPYTGAGQRLLFREGYKTYFIKSDRGVYTDTRIPITSTSSFSDFPEEFVDKDLTQALNWASKSKYKVDGDYHDFVTKLLYFKDDKGKAKYYDDLNEYKHYIAGRDDSYERFKTMQWLRSNDSAFSNNAFIDHRGRVYERGFIGPQAGETFRPFLNTAKEMPLGKDGYQNLQDTIGAFLGGLDDYFEGRFDSLTFPGRQKIAERWREDLVRIGTLALRGKPNDIRKILESPLAGRIEGEELGKFFRLAIEQAKIDIFLKGNYRKLNHLDNYYTGLALEQDASSSGAQIIALTTRNKQLAAMSNVVPTQQKRRLYDEIAAETYNDPRFREMNKKFNLTEKDLRKAAKAQNMVTFNQT